MQHTKQKIFDKTQKWVDRDEEKVYAPSIPVMEGGTGIKVEKISAIRPRGTDSAKLMVVIVTESLKGCGTEDDPVSVVKQYWSIDGELLATGER